MERGKGIGMIQTVMINSLDDAKNLIFEQERNKDNRRYRSSFFYRGMSDVSYSMLTSLARNCKDKADILENSLLENFTKYASIEDPTINESIWKAMIVGQHHGLPTRLLDWTHSVLVALHFAMSEGDFDNLDKHDCVVWRIDANELHKNLPEKYKETLRRKHSFMFSIKDFSETVNSLDEYDKDMGTDSIVMVEPPSIDQRIVNQYSFFAILPKGIKNLEEYLEQNTSRTVKYVISKDIRWDLRDILDQLNMSERTIFPGIDGLSRWLARHYFVKGDK